MTQQCAPAIGCEPMKNGRVKLFFIHQGKAMSGIEMPAEDVGNLVCYLLAAAKKAAELSSQSRPDGHGQSLAGMALLKPTRLGLSRGEPPEPMGLVVHAGMARMGIALSNPRELGEALLAASAPEGRPQ